MLTAEHHDRLIKNLDAICHTANVPKSFLNKSAKEFCIGGELDWLTHFPINQREGRGLVLLGKHTPPPDIKMMAMAAALLRNYIDARVVTVQTLLEAYESHNEVPDPTVLLIPNLYVRQGGKGLPSWKMQMIYDLLLSRFTAGKVTVVYVEDMKALAAEYGSLIVQHLEASYTISEG